MTHVFSGDILAADLSPSFMGEEVAPELVLPVEVATRGRHPVLTEGASTKVNARAGVWFEDAKAGIAIVATIATITESTANVRLIDPPNIVVVPA